MFNSVTSVNWLVMTTRETPLSDASLALLAELKRGGEVIFDNAQQLCKEGRILAQSGAFARSACLHQLSNEECGKIDIVGGWAMSIVLGDSVDAAQVSRALRDHKTKNYTNAYFSGVTDEERNARDQRNWNEALNVFRRQQAEIHRLFNTQKNAALYVNFEDGRFSAPKDVITEAFAGQMAALNDYFLGIAANHVRLLRTLESNDRSSHTFARRLVARLAQLKEERPDDPEEVLRIAMQEMFDDVLGHHIAQKGEREA